MSDFQLVTRFEPAGDQPEAIRLLVEGIDAGLAHQTLLGELTRQGKALVVVSSDLRELMLICDRIGVLSAGRLIETFERDSWTQDELLAAAFAGYQKRDALLNDAALRDTP